MLISSPQHVPLGSLIVKEDIYTNRVPTTVKTFAQHLKQPQQPQEKSCLKQQQQNPLRNVPHLQQPNLPQKTTFNQKQLPQVALNGNTNTMIKVTI